MNKHITGWLMVFGILSLTAAASAANALELIWPLDGSYVTKSNYLIIKGGRDPFLDGMSIEVNGVKSDVIDLTGENYRSSFADMLVVEPIFDAGKNLVIVEGFLNGKRLVSTQMTVFYQNDMTVSPPVDYAQAVFHLAEREQPCLECHDMQPSVATAADPRLSANACASCHRRMLDQSHVHGPAGAFQCLSCHDAGSTPQKYQARGGDALVCQECHTEKVGDFDQQKFLHGPLQAGMCLVCHDPHASAQPGQLVSEVNDLCFSCHVTVLTRPHVASGTSGSSHPLQASVNPMDPTKSFNCASCHDPHSGASEAYFINGISGRMQLCGACHKK